MLHVEWVDQEESDFIGLQSQRRASSDIPDYIEYRSKDGQKVILINTKQVCYLEETLEPG